MDGSPRSIVGKDLEMKNIQINGSSGNVQLDFLQFQGDLYATLTSGNISVSLNEDEPNAMISIKSNSGRRSVNFMLENDQQSKKETKGTLGSGENEIQLETSSGNIKLN